MTEGNHKKNSNQFGQHRELNLELYEYETSVMNFDRCYVLCILKLYHRHSSQSVGAGIRAYIFNRCNDATVRTWEVPLVHVSCTYTQSLHAINDLLAVGNYFVDTSHILDMTKAGLFLHLPIAVWQSDLFTPVTLIFLNIYFWNSVGRNCKRKTNIFLALFKLTSLCYTRCRGLVRNFNNSRTNADTKIKFTTHERGIF